VRTLWRASLPTILDVYRAVLFDFGGVITTSPFDAFAEYERELGIDVGTIRSINARSIDSNAWARLERGESDIPTFIEEFEQEAAQAGVELDGARVLACLQGQLRPRMVRALERCSALFATAIVTNNFHPPTADPESSPSAQAFAALAAVVDVVVESSRAGVRKPEPAFYELALSRLGVSAHEAILLDDLGVNLKPARAMGMTTIKVVDPDEALEQLSALTGLDF